MAEPAGLLGPPLRASTGPRSEPFGGWRIVLVAATCHALGFALIGVIAFVNTPIAREFGATQTEIGIGLSLSILSPALCGAPLGWLLDRGPLKAIMLGGLAVMLGGIVLLSQAQSLGALVGGFTLTTIGMSMYGHFAAHVLIVNWYVLGRGRALGLATAGVSVTAFLLPQIAARLVAAFGWRHAVLVIGFGAAAIAAPVIALFAVKRPEDVGQHPDGLPPLPRDGRQAAGLVEIPMSSLFREPAFWLIGLGIALAFSSGLPGFYLVRYMETELGIPPIHAAIIPSTQAVFGLIGKLATGWAVDRFDKRSIVLAILALHALGWVIAVQQTSLAGLMLAAIPLGLGGGSFQPIAPVIQGSCFGRAMIGRVNGMHALMALPLLIIITPLAGWVEEQTGSFVQPFLGLAGICALAALAFAFVRIPEVEPGR